MLQEPALEHLEFLVVPCDDQDECFRNSVKECLLTEALFVLNDVIEPVKGNISLQWYSLLTKQ